MTIGESPTGLRGAELLAHQLQRLAAFRRRSEDTLTVARRRRLTVWQSARLANTHRDLLASPRFGPAVRFFLSDLYAPRDFDQRYADLERIAPMLVRTLPREVIHTLALAVEMNVLTLTLDDRLARQLGGLLDGELSASDWVAAVRRGEDLGERERQIDLIRLVGEDLDRIIAKPGVALTLRMSRQPARMAGVGELHGFLVRGFGAFRTMRGAGPFLQAITGREQEILSRISSGHDRPLAIAGGG